MNMLELSNILLLITFRRIIIDAIYGNLTAVQKEMEAMSEMLNSYNIMLRMRHVDLIKSRSFLGRC